MKDSKPRSRWTWRVAIVVVILCVLIGAVSFGSAIADTPRIDHQTEDETVDSDGEWKTFTVDKYWFGWPPYEFVIKGDARVIAEETEGEVGTVERVGKNTVLVSGVIKHGQDVFEYQGRIVDYHTGKKMTFKRNGEQITEGQIVEPEPEERRDSDDGSGGVNIGDGTDNAVADHTLTAAGVRPVHLSVGYLDPGNVSGEIENPGEETVETMKVVVRYHNESGVAQQTNITQENASAGDSFPFAVGYAGEGTVEKVTVEAHIEGVKVAVSEKRWED